MSNDLIAILFWALGWVLLSIGYFIYKVVIDRDRQVSKKVHAWRAFWNGWFSWLGIFVIIAFLIVGGILAINEWVEDKLS